MRLLILLPKKDHTEVHLHFKTLLIVTYDHILHLFQQHWHSETERCATEWEASGTRHQHCLPGTPPQTATSTARPDTFHHYCTHYCLLPQTDTKRAKSSGCTFAAYWQWRKLNVHSTPKGKSKVGEQTTPSPTSPPPGLASLSASKDVSVGASWLRRGFTQAMLLLHWEPRKITLSLYTAKSSMGSWEK